jgi:hypothetical protein
VFISLPEESTLVGASGWIASFQSGGIEIAVHVNYDVREESLSHRHHLVVRELAFLDEQIDWYLMS